MRPAPHRASIRASLAVGLLAALGFASSAVAAPPRTTITIEIVFGEPTVEEFWATGGIVCDHGFAVTDPSFIAGFGRQGRGTGTFHLIKTLTCDDGEWFQILVNAAAAPNSGGTIGGFSVRGGSDAYATLRGGGQITGVGTETGIIDTYEGYLRT